jgi:hypothetical protein
MKNPKLILPLLALAAGLTLNGLAQTPPPAAPAAITDPGTTMSAIDLIRLDIKNEKAIIIAQNMTFTDDETAEFWPLYNDYTVALNLLLDERLAVIREYIDTYDKMTDAQATVLAGKYFDFEAKRVDLKRTWYKKFTEVVPAKKATQFFQIENQLNAALDLMLTNSLPLIK